MTTQRARHGRYAGIHLQPQGQAALETLQAATGLTMSDCCNLGLIALANGWVKLPRYKLGRQAVGGKRCIEWTI